MSRIVVQSVRRFGKVQEQAINAQTGEKVGKASVKPGLAYLRGVAASNKAV